MSQALFEAASQGRHEALSAGTTPAEHIHPEVIEVMDELGLDLRSRKPQRLTHRLAEQADIVITMGCGDQCPVIPGKQYIDWDLPDPHDQPIEQVRVVRDEIRQRVRDLIAGLDPSS